MQVFDGEAGEAEKTQENKNEVEVHAKVDQRKKSALELTCHQSMKESYRNDKVTANIVAYWQHFMNTLY